MEVQDKINLQHISYIAIRTFKTNSLVFLNN